MPLMTPVRMCKLLLIEGLTQEQIPPETTTYFMVADEKKDMTRMRFECYCRNPNFYQYIEEKKEM
jgi:hypothetical protein